MKLVIVRTLPPYTVAVDCLRVNAWEVLAKDDKITDLPNKLHAALAAAVMIASN